jgi:predicted amidohydrolase YtcJ
MEADLVLVDCNVLTMNSFQPEAESIIIQGNRIIKVCTKKNANRWIGKNTKVVSLKGSTVVPGLIDTHVHIADFGRFLTWLDLKSANSIKEIQKIVKKRVREKPQSKWILGQGWDQTSFAEKRMPNKQDLDEAAPDHPVVLYHQSGCMCVVNSKAIELAGLTKEVKTPLGGSIEMDQKTGDLTGVLCENAMNLVWKVIPEPDEEEVFDATCLACEKVLEAGITSVHWIVSSLDEIKLIHRIRVENKLPMRVHIIFPVNILKQVFNLHLTQKGYDEWVKIGSAITFLDGSLAERTAALKQPYSDDPNSKGKLFYTPTEFHKLVDKLHRSNFNIVIHAMGDQAIEMALSTLEKILKKWPKENHRYRIEQAAILNEDQIKWLKKIGVKVAVQPCTIISEFTSWSAIDRLGKKRARWLYPLKTMINKGLEVSGGSDCPMEDINPFSGIQSAVTREFFSEEQITVEDALRMYTVNAASAAFDEKIKGSIEKGKLADLTVISRDPRTTPQKQIENIEVEMTIVDGKIAYSKSPIILE